MTLDFNPQPEENRNIPLGEEDNSEEYNSDDEVPFNEDFEDDEEEDFDKYETFRCKWLAEGSKTIIEMAEALESAARSLRNMHEEGYILVGEMSDDYAWIKPPDNLINSENNGS